MKHILLFFCSIVLFYSCEERPVVIPDFVVPETDKVVLIEEFSGVSCSNCPAGAAEVEKIRHDFSGNVVSVTYYTDLLGEVRPESKYDFRTAESRALESYLGILIAKPAASIDRTLTPDDETFNVRRATWFGAVEDQLQEFSSLSLTGNANYDEENDQVSVAIKIVPKNDISGNSKLTVLATESHIIDAQIKPQGVEDLEYEHNHVFRKFLSDLEGLSLNGDLLANVEYDFSFELSVDQEWVIENMDIIAFVVNDDVDGKNEVVQALEISIIE